MRHETFSTPGPVALDLRIPAGEVAVEAATGLTETSVELEALRGEGAEELVEATRIECRPGRDGESEVVVEVPENRRFGIFGETAEVRLTLRCPDGARLGVRAASADLQARGRFSAADVQTASGDAEVDEVDGEVRAKAASGDLTFRRIGQGRLDAASGDVEVGRLEGEGRIRTASGDVTVDVAESSLEVSTASGDQRIDEVASGRVTLKSASGDLRVGVRRGVAVWVDATSMSGGTTSDLDLGAEPSGAEGPTVEVKATTMSGDVQIVRAGAR